MEIITSRQNRKIVELCALSDRKKREETGLFRFDGVKLLEEYLKTGRIPQTAFLDESRADAVLERLEGDLGQSLPTETECIYLSADLFARVSEEKSPEGVISVAKHLDKSENSDIIYKYNKIREAKSIVMLESVRDPVNVGAILRTAGAIGVDLVILSHDCADLYSPKTLRASMGAVFTQPILTADDLSPMVEECKREGRRVYASALHRDAMVLGQFETKPDDCIVIGNEGHGISDELLSQCTHTVYIPMTDRAESFNASIASAILMWEFYK